MLRHFKSDRDEIAYGRIVPWVKYASVDGIGFSMWRHNFKIALQTVIVIVITNWNLLRPCLFCLMAGAGERTDRQTDRQTDKDTALCTLIVASRYWHQQNNNLPVAQCNDYTADIMYSSGAFVSFHVTAWHKINYNTQNTAVIHRKYMYKPRSHFRTRWIKLIENAKKITARRFHDGVGPVGNVRRVNRFRSPWAPTGWIDALLFVTGFIIP